MPLRAVTFDFHNTLAVCDAWFELEVREIVPRFLDWYQHVSGNPVPDSVRSRAADSYRSFRLDIIQHGVERDAVDGVIDVLNGLEFVVERGLVEAGVEHLMRETLPGSVPVPGSVDAVRQLHAAGVILGVISNAVYHPFLEWSLDKFGTHDLFSSLVTSSSGGYYKSRPELYDHALQALGVPATDAVHIGDSYRFDVEGARRVGMRTVWYRTSAAEGEGNAADLTVSTLDGLAETILSQFGNS